MTARVVAQLFIRQNPALFKADKKYVPTDLIRKNAVSSNTTFTFTDPEAETNKNMPQHWYANHGMKIQINEKLKLDKICLKMVGHPALRNNLNVVKGLKNDIDDTVRKVGLKLA